MGQQNSTSIKPISHKLFQTKNKDTIKSINDSIQFDTVVKYVHQSEINLQKEIFNFRLVHKNLLVAPQGFQIQTSQNFICNSQNHRITYYFQPVQKCLFDIKELSVNQGLTLLTHCIKGFTILFKTFGYFIPQAEMIICQNQNWKVWISPDLTQIKTQARQIKSDDQILFSKKLIRLFDILKDSENPNFSYSDFIFANSKNIKVKCLQNILTILCNQNHDLQILKAKEKKLKKHQRKKSLSYLNSYSSKFSSLNKNSLESTKLSPFTYSGQNQPLQSFKSTKQSFNHFKNLIRNQESQYLIHMNSLANSTHQRKIDYQSIFQSQKNKIKNVQIQPKIEQNDKFKVKNKITQRTQKNSQSQIQISLPKQSYEDIEQQTKQILLKVKKDDVIQKEFQISSHKIYSRKSYQQKQQVKDKKHKRSLTDKTQQKQPQKKKVKICCSQEFVSDIFKETNQKSHSNLDEYRKKIGMEEVLQTYKQFDGNQQETQLAIKFKTSQSFKKSLNNKGKTVKSIKILDSDMQLDEQLMKDLNFIMNNGFVRRGNKCLSINATIIQMKQPSL